MTEQYEVENGAVRPVVVLGDLKLGEHMCAERLNEQAARIAELENNYTKACEQVARLDDTITERNNEIAELRDGRDRLREIVERLQKHWPTVASMIDADPDSIAAAKEATP